MGPTGKIVIAFLAGIALTVVGLHLIWQADNRGAIDLSGWIARYERAFEPEGGRPMTGGNELVQRVAQLERRIASLENAMSARTESAPSEQPAENVATTRAPTEAPVITGTARNGSGDYSIEILNWEWTLSRYTAKYVNATGLVRNVSKESLQRIYASVRWYDAEGNFLISQDTRLDIDPLPPGETASFKVSIPRDSRMHSARLRFKTGRGTIIPSPDSVRAETALEIPPLTE